MNVVIARLCRAFFIHERNQQFIDFAASLESCDCPVMSGFFHALLSQEQIDI